MNLCFDSLCHRRVCSFLVVIWVVVFRWGSCVFSMFSLLVFLGSVMDFTLVFLRAGVVVLFVVVVCVLFSV